MIRIRSLPGEHVVTLKGRVKFPLINGHWLVVEFQPLFEKICESQSGLGIFPKYISVNIKKNEKTQPSSKCEVLVPTFTFRFHPDPFFGCTCLDIWKDPGMFPKTCSVFFFWGGSAYDSCYVSAGKIHLD